MRVGVKLFAGLSRYAPVEGAGRSFELELPEGVPVAELVRCIGIPEQEARLVFVNGISRSYDWPLRDGDQVGIFPRIGGG